MHIAYAWGDLLNSMLDLNTTLKVHHGHQQGHFAFRNIAEGSSSSYAVYEDPSSCRERLVCNCSTRLAEHTLRAPYIAHRGINLRGLETCGCEWI